MNKKKFNTTQQLNVDELLKSIPVICSWCNKIYHIKQWQAEKGKQAIASHGMCQECEKKQLEELQAMTSGTELAQEDKQTPSEMPFKGTKELNVDEMSKTIPIVCSWCNKIYHMKQWQVEKGKRTGVSHGMCADCEKKQLEELERLKNSN